MDATHAGEVLGADEGARCEVLETRVRAAARGAPRLRRALARVAGRMVALRGWERLGFARLGDYAAERGGVSGRELRDLAAVDRALGALPALEAAFLAGRLGWTQLRLLCRVAQPEEQGRWLSLAGQLTARALAREVRAVDRQAAAPLGTSEPEGDERVGVVLRISRRAHARWWAARGLASKVAGHRLSHAAFAEVLAAELMSAMAVEVQEKEPGEGAARASLAVSIQETCPASPPPDVAPLLESPDAAGLERDLESADAFELDARLRRGLALEARAAARLAALLVEASARGLHREFGFRSFDAWVEEGLGLARSRARALLRIGRAALVCPELGGAFANGRLGWVQAETLITLLFEPAAARQREAWIAHAERVSVRRLRDDAERALASGDFSAPPGASTDPEGVQTGANTRAAVEDARLFFPATPEVAQLLRVLLAATQRRLERVLGRPAHRSEALEAMLAHAVATWQGEPGARVPREWRVFERDGWRCTAPGCTSQRNLQRHHVVFRSRGGPDDDANLTTLCAWHHLRGIHGGRLRCTGTAPGGLHFELGLRAGRPPLAVYAPGETRIGRFL